jgi:hypothetical protein
MLELDLARVRANVAAADTEDLLDRATVYRAGMEVLALDFIDAELHRRGVRIADMEAHEVARRAEAIPRDDGTVERCDFCRRPAVVRHWGWHRVWGRFPVFPRWFLVCPEHRPAAGLNSEDQVAEGI